MQYEKNSEERRKKISEIVAANEVCDQKQLVWLLRREGIETNQAVVSRDLRKLGVTKKQVKDQLVYELPTTDIKIEILKLGVVDIRYNEVTIVVQTLPALAAFVGDYLDACADLDILGCIAGENMVFITPKSIKTIASTYRQICQRMHYKQGFNE